MNFWKIDFDEATELPEEGVLRAVKSFVQSGTKWHFHMLTPDCRLNESGEYVLMVEDVSSDEFYTLHSKEKPSALGKQLVELLHGKDVTDQKTTSKEYLPSEEMQKIISRAKGLNEAETTWHHHMLFPNCKFNTSGKWEIILEDPKSNEILKSLSENEPKEDLKQIEELFYKN